MIIVGCTNVLECKRSNGIEGLRSLSVTNYIFPCNKHMHCYPVFNESMDCLVIKLAHYGSEAV